MRLYTHSHCPFAQRAVLALQLARLPYESIEVDLYGPGITAYKHINPKGLVPALVLENDRNRVIPESEDILDFIDTDLLDPSASPDGVLQKLGDTDKAQRLWYKEQADILLKEGRVCYPYASKRMVQTLQEIDARLYGPFAAKCGLSIIDCSLFPFVWRIEREFGSVLEIKTPRLYRWLDTMGAHEAVQRTLSSGYWMWW